MKKFMLLGLFVSASLISFGQYAIGDKVENFKLPGIDGNWFALDEQKDVKGLIVTFTCNTCPVAQKYEERIVNLDR